MQKTSIKADLSMALAAQHNMPKAKEPVCAFAAPAHFLALHVNTVIDSRPSVAPVVHPPTPALRDLAQNGKLPGRVKRRQLWAAGAHFPNAHAFPDNPLRTDYDYLHR
jgi:hypothetical protein